MVCSCSFARLTQQSITLAARFPNSSQPRLRQPEECVRGYGERFEQEDEVWGG